MLWNFEDGITDSGENSLGTSSSAETDPLSSMLASMVRQPPAAAVEMRAMRGLDFGGIVGVDRAHSMPHPNDQQLEPSPGQMLKCTLCHMLYKEPKVLACFHSFCKACLERQLALEGGHQPELLVPQRIVCPMCTVETQLSPQLGIEGLLSDYGLENAVQSLGQSLGTSPFSEQSEDLGFGSLGSAWLSPPDQCTGCKSGERATAFCRECANFLCLNCAQAHLYMNIFEGHTVEELASPASVGDQQQAKQRAPAEAGGGHPGGGGGGGGSTGQQPHQCMCLEHRLQPLVLFCQFCQQAICRDCMPDHQECVVEQIDTVAEKQIAMMERLLNEARMKQNGLTEMFQLIDVGQAKLNTSFNHAKQTIDDACSFLIQAVHEAQKGLYSELESIYGYKQLQLTMLEKEVQKVAKRMSQTIEFTQRLLKFSSPTEVIVFKPLLDSRLQGFLTFNADANNLLRSGTCEIRMNGMDLQQARQTLMALVNSLRSDSWLQAAGQSPARQSPLQQQQFPGMAGDFVAISMGGGGGGFDPHHRHRGSVRPFDTAADLLSSFGSLGGPQQMGPGMLATSAPTGANFADPKWASPTDLLASLSLNSSDLADLNMLGGSNGGGAPKLATSVNGGGKRATPEQQQMATAASSIPLLYPPRSQIKRQKMTYNCKFGEFGVMEGQFTEPSGVAVNAQFDLIVADTNNHRIQVFDREGRFKFQFGECGKRDGQLLYPNRVAVNRVTGDFVVTERSPTHQIQIYNQYGQFIRKFGASILQHPRGVCVDSQGRIVVVECKVMRVLIFDMYGNILHKFSCSRYLEFPNGVCTTEKEEILISDNRAHSIKVFSYEGQFLRQIGGEGITNYPIGVGINQMGEVVVADNHNNFNLTIFSQDGNLLSAYESKVKHAQCYDVALIDDSVVLASKDYRLYLYKYQQINC